MAEHLKNTLPFDLAPGASAVIPHGLMTAVGRPLAPDIIFNPSRYLSIIADVINVTVTNNGAAAMTGNILVEAWHTIERAFGDINDEDLPVKPYIVVSDSEAALEAPLLTLVFRPGATGAEAPGGNVFTDWTLLMQALDATKFLGLRAIDFDNRFAPNPATDPVLAPFLAFNTPGPLSSGLWPCAIPPPPPGSAWDMRDVIWQDRGLAPGGDSPAVQFWDGGPGRPCLVDNLKRIDSLLLNLIYNGKTVGNYPIISSRSAPGGQYGIQFSGGRGRILNTDASAQPLWLADVTPSFVNLRNDAQLGNGVPLPAPLIEVAAGKTFLTFGLDNFEIMDNCFKGPVGSTVSVRVQSAGQGGDTHSFTYSNPSFLGAYSVQFLMNAQRWRASAILAANGNAFHGDVVRVNTSAGAIRVTLPHAGPIAPSTGTSPFQGSAITVLDVAGDADANPITVRAQVGDSINGNVEAGGGESDFSVGGSAYASARFWCDGAKNWFVIT